ncbi:MAG TPA: site-specific DNA-methyltransferase [bacterium]|nr:site-specific DNA-methyltransferase [bacterium]
MFGLGEKAKLFNEDCFETFKRLKDQSIYMVMCDPPYGTTACEWDSIIPLEPMWKELERVVKSDGVMVFIASQPFTTTLISSNMKMFKYCWVWNKKKGGNIFGLKYQPYKIHEDVVVFNSTEKTYFPVMVDQKERTGKTYGIGEAFGGGNYGDERVYKKKNPKSIIEISNADQRGKKHPTQKPVALMEYLIKTYTNEGEVVLDFAMGSGTTGVACMNLGRKFIGCDNDVEHGYFEIAKERILHPRKLSTIKPMDERIGFKLV